MKRVTAWLTAIMLLIPFCAFAEEEGFVPGPGDLIGTWTYVSDGPYDEGPTIVFNRDKTAVFYMQNIYTDCVWELENGKLTVWNPVLAEQLAAADPSDSRAYLMNATFLSGSVRISGDTLSVVTDYGEQIHCTRSSSIPTAGSLEPGSPAEVLLGEWNVWLPGNDIPIDQETLNFRDDGICTLTASMLEMTQTVDFPWSFRDGKLYLAALSADSGGMALYIDGEAAILVFSLISDSSEEADSMNEQAIVLTRPGTALTEEKLQELSVKYLTGPIPGSD